MGVAGKLHRLVDLGPLLSKFKFAQKKCSAVPFNDLLYSPVYSFAPFSYVAVAVWPNMSYGKCTGCYAKQGGCGHTTGAQAQVRVAPGPRAHFHFSSIFFRIFDFGKI